MFSGADTEWLPTLGASWHVPQVPASGLPMTSLIPATSVMLMVRELNSVCPRRILARRAAATSSEDALAQELLNNVKITGVNGVPNWFPAGNGSLMLTKKG